MISSTSLVLTLSHSYSYSDSGLYRTAVSLQTLEYKWLRKLIPWYVKTSDAVITVKATKQAMPIELCQERLWIHEKLKLWYLVLNKVRERRWRDGREKRCVAFLSCNQQRAKWNVSDSAEYNGPQFSFRVITHVLLLFKNPAPLIKASHCSTSGTGQ